MPPELAQWIPPAVIIALMIYLHRSTHRRMDRMEARLSEDIKEVRAEVRDLRDRLGRVEGYLDVLREFFVGSGRGTAA